MSADPRSLLVEAGLSEGQARSKAALLERAISALPAPPEARFFVPGRVEVFGKHTDYAGGRSLLAAVERGFCVAAAPRADETVRVLDALRGEAVELALDGDGAARLIPAQAQAPDWAPYAEAVVRRAARDFPAPARGADIALASDLPACAGLASSSALVVGLFSGLAAILRLEERGEFRDAIRSNEDLAEYLGSVESGRAFGPFGGDRGAGAFIGSEDHTAILCCGAGRLAQYAFLPVRRERTISLPDGWTFLIAASGVTAEKTGRVRERYNSLSREAEVLLTLAETGGRGLLEASAPDPGSADRIREVLAVSSHPEFSSDRLARRFEQFYEESVRIIPAAADALAAGAPEALGPLADRSQRLAEDILENQVPQTIFLARSARELGAAAASAFGAGFGGSVWALVPASGEEEFRSRWAERYRRAFPREAARSEIFTSRPGPAVQRL